MKYYVLLIACILLLPLASASLNSDLVTYFTMNQTSGNIIDELGITNMSNTGELGVSGIIGTAVRFHGDQTFMTNITTAPQMSDESWTVSAWFTFSNQTGNNADLMTYLADTGSNTYGWGFERKSSGQLQNLTITVFNSSGSSTVIETPMMKDTFNHVTLSYNGTGLKTYWNGTLFDTRTFLGFRYGGNSDFAIGCHNAAALGCAGGTRSWNGTVDEVAFWDRQLLDGEVAELYNNGNGLTYPLYTEAVTLDSPEDNAFIIIEDIVFNATLTNQGNSNFTNATLYVWDADSNVVNQTTNTVTGQVVNNTSFTISNLEYGSYDWNVLGCFDNSTASNCLFALQNNSFTYGYQINNEVFSSEVADTSLTNITLNITEADNVLSSSAILYYNNTAYTPTRVIEGSNTIYYSQLEVPIVQVSTNKSFSWNITITSDFGTETITTDTQTQTIVPSIFTGCNATYPTEALNLTVYDESSPTSIISADNFDITLSWTLGASTKKTNSFSEGSGSTFSYCISPNQTYQTEVSLEVRKTGYHDKVITLGNRDYTNTSTLEKIYLLNESVGTSVIVEVRDQGLSPLEDYEVRIYRYYPSTNDYLLVHDDFTDTFGQVTPTLIEDDVNYRFEFYDTNGNLATDPRITKIACRSTIACVLPFVIEDQADDFARFETITGLTSQLIYSNTSNNFLFTWSDITDHNAEYNLTVIEYLFNGTTTVCSELSTSKSGTFTCTLPTGYKATYTATVNRIVAGKTTRLHVLSVTLGDVSDIFGREGLIWAFIIVFTITMVGLFSPVIGVALYLASIIVLGISNIIYMSPAFFISQLIIGGFFIWAFKN